MSLRRSLGWMSLSQGGLVLIQFGGAVFLSRLLTPYEMGVYAIATAIIGVLSVVQTFGLAGFMVREAELSRDLIASVFTINTLLALLLSLGVVGFSLFGGWFLSEPGVQRVMIILAILPLLGAAEFIPLTSLEREGKFKVIALVSLARAVATTSVTISLALAGFSFMSLAYGTLVGATVTAVSYNLVGRHHVTFRLGVSEWRRITRYGVQMLAISGVNTLSTRVAEALLGRILGLSALGLYSRASGLNNLLWDNIHMVIGRVVFVDLAGLRRQGISLRETYLRTVEIVTALLWPAFAGMAVVAGPLILTVYGPTWVPAAGPLSMLSLAAIVLVSITMTWEIFVVCGETGRQARFETVRTGFGLVAFACGCLVSLTGAAAGRIVEALFSLWMYRPHLERMTGTVGRDFVAIYSRSIALTVVATGPSLMVMVTHGWSPKTSLAFVLPAIAGGVVLWLLVLASFNRHPLAEEIRRLAARRWPSLSRLAPDEVQTQ